MKKNLKFISVFLATLFTVCAYAAALLMVENAWVRASESSNTAVYMDLKNLSKEEYVLVNVTSPDNIASTIELHKTVTENGISQMVHIDRLVIPAQGQVSLAPKGLHIMLMGLKHKLTKGMPVNLVLHFADGKKMDLIANVR